MDPLGILDDRNLGDVSLALGVPVGGLGYPGGDKLVLEPVPQPRRVELADELALLDPGPLDKDRNDGRAALDLAEHVLALGRFQKPLPSVKGSGELAGLDYDHRTSAAPSHLGISLGLGLSPRRSPPGQQVDGGGRRAEDEQDRSGLQPLDRDHGSENPLGEGRNGPLDKRPDRGQLNRGAVRGIEQCGRNERIRTAGLRRSGDQCGSGGQAAADEPVAEPLPPPRMPALDRPDRPSQMPGCVLVRVPLEIAEDQGCAVALGKAVDFLVEHPPQFVVRLGEALPGRRCRGCSLFVPAAPGRGRPGARCRAASHLMEPGAQGIAHPEAAGLLHQHQEGGLEGILRVLGGIGQHAPADAQDHRSMPLDQDREGQLGRLAPAAGEPLQELSIGQLPDRPHAEERAKLPDDCPILSERHGSKPPQASRRQ